MATINGHVIVSRNIKTDKTNWNTLIKVARKISIIGKPQKLMPYKMNDFTVLQEHLNLKHDFYYCVCTSYSLPLRRHKWQTFL